MQRATRRAAWKENNKTEYFCSRETCQLDEGLQATVDLIQRGFGKPGDDRNHRCPLNGKLVPVMPRIEEWSKMAMVTLPICLPRITHCQRSVSSTASPESPRPLTKRQAAALCCHRFLRHRNHATQHFVRAQYSAFGKSQVGHQLHAAR